MKYVQLDCTLEVLGQQVSGTCLVVENECLYVRTSRTFSVEYGEPVRVVFRDSQQDGSHSFAIQGESMWTNPGEKDIRGNAALGIAIRRVLNDAETTAALNRLVETQKPTLLVVDDEPTILRIIERMFKKDYRVMTFSNGREALEVFESRDVSVLITDQNMPLMSGVELLTEVAQRFPGAHTVRMVLSAHTDLDALQEFVNHCKISRFLTKPFDNIALSTAIQEATAQYYEFCAQAYQTALLAASNQQLQAENFYLKQRIAHQHTFGSIVGNSPRLREALDQFDRVRRSDVTVHIHGETGTGKELVARALHDGGPRGAGPFVAQNCGGLTESLLQSTLFGHRRGAFTGADRDRPGVFVEANGGTLFLDEVGELSPLVQSALLRAIQEREVMPVGGSRPVKVDVRIISATHKDLREEVAAGRFREDLYFRLMVVAISLPPLRERSGDIPLLAQHFFDVYCTRYKKELGGLARDVMNAFQAYSWPGNVRELANEVERLVVLTEEKETVRAQHLSPHILPKTEGLPSDTTPEGVWIPYDMAYDEAMHRLSSALVERALSVSGGIIRQAADVLQMERSRLAKLRRRL